MLHAILFVLFALVFKFLGVQISDDMMVFCFIAGLFYSLLFYSSLDVLRILFLLKGGK